MLREGIEAALIVGIIAGYLKQTGRQDRLPAGWFGEGCVALIATGILAAMVLWMAKAARSIKAQLHDSIDAATGSDDGRSLALVGMAFLAVGREGLESVFFLIATLQQDAGLGVPIGATLG